MGFGIRICSIGVQMFTLGLRSTVRLHNATKVSRILVESNKPGVDFILFTPRTIILNKMKKIAFAGGIGT
jgi:hypothetical protein